MNKVAKMNSRGTLLLFAMLLISGIVIGQKAQEKDGKKLTKCWQTFKTKGYAKGISKLEKYMGKQPFSSLNAYELLVAMEYQYYRRNATLFEVEVTGEAEEGENDSLANSFKKSMEEVFENKFINICRKSTLESTSPTADLHLRNMLVDIEPDSLVSEKAQSYYEEGEAFFRKQDFELADLNYRKAIKEDASYYKAHLYLGDSFWTREEYDSAMFYYEIAKGLQPKLSEPRIFMIDALVEKGLYYRAKKECLEAMVIYPGYNLKFKLDRILSIENKYLNERRIVRTFFPNDIRKKDQISMSNHHTWVDYRKAKEDVSKYCNTEGIIEENGEIKDRYLEVYSMRKMLEEHANDLPKNLDFAEQMRKEGFLEPYVFISLFHIDIYPQFKDYMMLKANREKSIEFIEKYLIAVMPHN